MAHTNTFTMEPVPETERMEEFRSSPPPSLRLNTIPISYRPSPPSPLSSTSSTSSSFHSFATHSATIAATPPRKPPTLRRCTEPILRSPTSPSWSATSGPFSVSSTSAAALPFRPRTTSPLSVSDLPSRPRPVSASFASSSSMSLSRTQSLPTVNSAGHLIYSPVRGRPSSPSRPPRQLRKPVEDIFPTSPVRQSIFDHDKKVSNNLLPNRDSISAPPFLSRPNFRPASPPRSTPSISSLSSTTIPEASIAYPPPPSTPTSIPISSPSPPTRTLDSFPSFPPFAPSTGASASGSCCSSSGSIYGSSYGSSYGSNSGSMSLYLNSSVSSTPISNRSRSPSISSLETIADTPDAEEAATEADRIAQLKAAAEAVSEGNSDIMSESGRGKTSLDIPSRARVITGGPRDKARKRWSVCGAERRGDIDLETIWEV